MHIVYSGQLFVSSPHHPIRLESSMGSCSPISKMIPTSLKPIIRLQSATIFGSRSCKKIHTSPQSRIAPQTTTGSNSWGLTRATTSTKQIKRRRVMRLRPIAISQPLTSPPISSEDEVKDDGDKFNWFEQWYPVASEYDLDKKVPHAFTVLGLEVVVWWDKKEQAWRVFDDSCPHRRAPLSEGRIDEDGDLQCSYHGWCFGSLGECKYIPQAPSDGPKVHTTKRACVGVYPSLQQQGIIWFWPNIDPIYKDIILKKKPPFIPVLSDPSFRSILSMRDLPYGYEILTENLLDPSHVPYAHHGLASRADIGSSKAGSLKNDQRAGKPLDLQLQNLDKSGFQGEGGKSLTSFLAPCVIVSDFTFTPSKKGIIQTLMLRSKEDKKRTLFLVMICVPVAPGRSRLIWAFPRNFALWADCLLPRWITHMQQNLFLDSDLYFLHLEEHKLQQYGQKNWEKACYVPTKADTYVIAFRKWLKQYSNGGVPWANKFNGLLRLTPPKEQLMDRYWSHVVKCRSCKGALNMFRALEIIMQVLSILSVAALGIIAVIKKTPSSSVYVWNTLLVATAIVCYLASRWLSHFIYKTYYFHDYNHALIK